MEDLELFLKNIFLNASDLKGNDYIITGFLDETYQKNLEEYLKYHKNLKFYKSGGFINSVRNRVIITKDDKKYDFDIIVLKIIFNDKFNFLNHKNILGSLMSLGVKREVIGDIIKNDDKWYFAVTKEIYPFILNEFHQVGNKKIEIEKENNILEEVINLKYEKIIVSSMRADLIIKDSFHIPRIKAQECIREGLVFVNHLEIHKNDLLIDIGDEVNLRGKGKIKLVEYLGETKSDKKIIKIGRFI